MYLTLNNYLISAVKVLKHYGYGYLCKDEDAVSHIAEYMMKADQIFNETGSRDAFRVYYARFGILDYINRYNKKRHHNLSLDFDMCRGGTFKDLIPSEANGPEECASKTEILSMIENTDKLTDKQKQCINMHYLHGQTLDTIGKELGVTRERVRQIIQQSITILRELFDVDTVSQDR